MTSTDPHHDRVAAAAEAIAARGDNPTLSAVRAELGGGSFSTISPALRAWKAQQARTDAPVGEPLPEPLQEAAAAGAAQIWTAALELASERLSAERTALDAARAEAGAAVAEATATADELAAQLEAAQSAAQSAAEQHLAAETELREALEAEQARVKTAEKEQAVAQALAQERQREIDDARAQAKAAAERASAAEALAAARQSEIERAQALHRDLVARLEPAPTEEPQQSTPVKSVHPAPVRSRRTPTAGELEEYWAEARRQRRARDLTHAIQRAIDRNPELAARLTPGKLPGGRHGVELDDETPSQLRETLRRT